VEVGKVSSKYWAPEIETLPRDELEALQLRLLRHTVHSAYHNSAYYGRVMRSAGFDPDSIRTLRDIRKLPFVNKKFERERQEQCPPFGDHIAVPNDRIVRIHASSGTTGVPTASVFTHNDIEAWKESMARQFWGVGMRAGDIYHHALNMSLFVGGLCLLGAERLGAAAIPAGVMDTNRHLMVIKAYRPRFIWGTPSFMLHLSEKAREAGMDPAGLSIRKVIVAGEPGGSIPSTKRKIEEAWAADCYDYYGIADIWAPCATECEEKAGLHVLEDYVLPEVIDPETGEQVGEGEKGELVLTTLKREGQIMLRFRTGDETSYEGERCACGRTHLRLKGITGRTDDMVIAKGVKFYPSQVEEVLRKIPELSNEYQIVVNRGEEYMDGVAVKTEACCGDVEEIRRRLEVELKSVVGIRFDVEVLPLGTLPRTMHKAKRVLDLRRGQMACPA
jgi:phenylacetate-CoA ligase